MSEIEIPQDVTAAAILISNWMKEHGHDRWELFDLCSRNHVVELEKVKSEKESAIQSAKDNARNYRSSDLLRIEAQRERDEWKTVADILNHALGNDGIEANNPLSHQARTAALKLFASKKK